GHHIAGLARGCGYGLYALRRSRNNINGERRTNFLNLQSSVLTLGLRIEISGQCLTGATTNSSFSLSISISASAGSSALTTVGGGGDCGHSISTQVPLLASP